MTSTLEPRTPGLVASDTTHRMMSVDGASRLVRSLDWAETPLGPVENWPERLHASVDLILEAAIPMAILHGPKLVQIYNDRFSALMGSDHPGAFGRPVRGNWVGAWNIDNALLDQVWAGRTVTRDMNINLNVSGAVGQHDLGRLSLSPLRDREGAVTGVLATVTPRHQCAGTILQDAEDRAHALLVGNSLAMWEAENTGAALAESSSWRAYTGQGREDSLAFGWLNAVHPDDQPIVQATWRMHTAARQPFTMEHRLRTGHGEWRWVSVRVVPVLDESGHVRKWIGLNLDVHDRKQVEEQLRESQARGTFLLALSDAMRVLKDAEQIEEVACRLLADHLRCDRAYYVELSAAEGTARVGRHFQRSERPSFTGKHPISTIAWCLPMLEDGEPLVVQDVASEPRVPERDKAALVQAGLSAFVGIPLIKSSSLVGVLSVTTDVPRCWTSAEVTLLRETGERVWEAVERARAEVRQRASEARFRGFAEASANVLWIADVHGQSIDYLSPAFERVFGVSCDAATAGAPFISRLVHQDDRALFLSIAPRALGGEAVVAHYRVVRPDRSLVHVRDTAFLIRDGDGTLLHVAGLVQDVSDIEAAREALEAEKERFRILAEGVPQLVWRSDAEGRWLWASPQWLTHTGQTIEESLGFGWLDAVHPDDRASVQQAWIEKTHCGRIKVEYRVRRIRDNAWRWHAGQSAPIRRTVALQEECMEWLGATTDIEELKQMQQRQAVLVAELQHRTRNLLGVVNALAGQTIDTATSLDDFSNRFGRRLAALSRVQSLLSHLSAGQRVTFDELLQAELTALGAIEGECWTRRVTLEGPLGIPLRSATIQTLALALHELATNATKYGALRSGAGHLTVRWALTRGEETPFRLCVDWQESGVVMDEIESACQRQGYGRELIECALPYQLGAQTTFKFGPEGVHCTISMPIESMTCFP